MDIKYLLGDSSFIFLPYKRSIAHKGKKNEP